MSWHEAGSAEGLGRKWSNQACEESLLPAEGRVLLKRAGVNHTEPSTSFFSYPCPRPQIFAFHGGLKLHRAFSSSSF